MRKPNITQSHCSKTCEEASGHFNRQFLWNIMGTQFQHQMFLNHHHCISYPPCHKTNQQCLYTITHATELWMWDYVGLPKISKNFNIPRKPLAIRTCAAKCVLLYFSTNSQPTGIFITARVFEFWLFSLNRFHVCAIIEMADVKEQRICIKFCFKLNKTAAETHRMLKEAFGEQALSQARTFEWFKCFKDGWESVEDRKHSGQLSTCTTPKWLRKCVKLS